MVNRARTKEIILLLVLILVLINYVFFRYIYTSTTNRRYRLINTLEEYNTKVETQLNQFYTNLALLRKVALLKKEILFSKKNLEILQTSNVSTFDMAGILKTLLIQSGVSVYEITLSGAKNRNEKETYSFKVRIKDNLDKILKFMDLVENYSDNMYITEYSISPQSRDEKGYYSTLVSVNFDYVRLNQ